MMSGWDLGPPAQPPVLTREQAIEIALSDPITSPELRGLPVDAEYGSSLSVGWRGSFPDAWKVSVDVSSLGWEVGYEGPGAMMVDGKTYFPQHVRVPKVRAAIILVDDKLGQRVVSGTEAEPTGEHRIEWRRAGE